MNISLPLSKFHPDTSKDLNFFNQYFSGRTSIFSEDESNIILKWPDYDSFYIDPKLQVGLDYVEKGFVAADIPKFYTRKKNYQFSFNDNWTLFSWSEWLLKRKNANQPVDNVVIVHIDDHTDCMSPLVFKNGNKYIDPIINSDIKEDDPESIKNSILSGAISIGSFMPIFLHAFEQLELRHLNNTYRLTGKESWASIDKGFVLDEVFSINGQRPVVKFNKNTNSLCRYFVTDDLDKLLKDIPKDAPVLLHIDMDYFNNRFDGDSDWEQHSYRHDPDSIAIQTKIEYVIKGILDVIPRSQIDDITIAVSPGFFPAEFWQQSMELIDKLLERK